MKKYIVTLILVLLIFNICALDEIEALLSTTVLAEGINVDVYNFNDISSAVNNAASGSEIICYIKNDIIFDSSVIITKSLTLTIINNSENDTVTLSTNGGTFRHLTTGGLNDSSTKVSDVSITIDDGIVLDGQSAGGGIWLYGKNCSLNLGRCSILNCKGRGNGGGVGITGTSDGIGTLKINGANIENCVSTLGGGGIFANGCNVTLNSGRISNNASLSGAGMGICVQSFSDLGSTLTINGGEISYNRPTTSAYSDGGGIWAWDTIVTINNGEISYNEASGFAGGIFMRESTGSSHPPAKLFIHGGTIKGNKTGNYGGGIGLYTNISEFLMDDGIIEDNISGNQGGGIYINNSPMTANVAGGVIRGNRAKNGGGIYVNNSTLVVKDGAEISDNVASDKGGGICGYGTCHVRIENGSKIKGNTALSGGGISNFTTVAVIDSTVSENKAIVSTEDIEQLEQTWSGWYPTQKPSDFGIILPNDTWLDYVLLNYGGGGGIYSKGVVDVKNSNFTHNTSKLDAGGIWMSDLKNLTVDAASVFSRNIAKTGSLWQLEEAEMEEYTALHNEKIKTSQYSAQFSNLYNNFDVNFHAGITVVPVENGNTAPTPGTPSGTTYYTVKVLFQDINGNTIAPTQERTVSMGSSYNITANDIEWHQYVETVINGVTSDNMDVAISAVGMNYEIIFRYRLDRPSLNRLDHNWYVRGYPDNTMRSEGNLTRAETAMIFYRLIANTDKDNLIPRAVFGDIDTNEWYSKAITCLYDHDIISGYADNTFKPNTNITRAEIAKIACSFDNLEIPIGNPFSDVPDSHWAHDYIAAAAQRGWIVGYEDGTFRPNNNASRAEMMTLINKVLGRRIKTEDIPTGVHAWADLVNSHWAYADMMEAAHSHIYERPNESDYEAWISIIGISTDAAELE